MRLSLIFIFAVLLGACNSVPEDEIINGILEVPENRQDPNSRTLKLVYKVLKAKKPDSTKVPIVYLQGGPGGATLVMEEFWKNNPLRNDRDIILMDQRGTGASEASCSDIGKNMFAIAREDLDNDGEIRALKAVLSKCKDSMRKVGVDVAGYTSQENAADFEYLRKTLGYEQWNLLGVSYGSRLGLTIMREYPKGVRSTVLGAIMAPETDYMINYLRNFENSLFAVLERCERDLDCNGRYPKLKEKLFKVLEKLKSDPLHFDYNGKPFVLNPQDAFLILHLSLYDSRSAGNIPLLIRAIDSGEIEPIVSTLRGVEYLYNLINWPMNFSVMAYEELPFYDELEMTETSRQSSFPFEISTATDLSMQILNDWHSYRASDFEDQPVVSEIPTLMASGGLDPVTPIGNATEALKHLKNGYELIFLDEGHNLFNPCFFQITEEFLNNPHRKPGLECSQVRNPIEWNLGTSIQ